MRFRILVCAPAVCYVLALSFLQRIQSADALLVKKRLADSPAHKQQAKHSFRFASTSSSYELDQPVKPTNQQSSSSSVSTSSSSSVASATIPQEVFNLVKSIIGAGTLSLPAGIALMASKGSGGNNGIILSTSCLLIAIMGSISAYTFSLIARVCKMTKSDTYAECWRATRGQSMAWIIALSSTLDCFAGNLTFSMVLADTFRQLLSSICVLGGKGIIFPSVFKTIGAYNSRTMVLLLLTMTTLIPLCCVKNLSSLAPFSLVGIIGMVYMAVVIALRYFDGSYRLPGGRFLADLNSLPSLEGGGIGGDVSFLSPLTNPKSLILVSMLSTAFIAHFNAPKFYRELKDSDTKPKRFHLGVVASSFALCVFFYAFVSSMGYLTFGSATKGMILSNYSNKDVLISLSRFAMGLSLIFSYPLLFVGLRDGIVDLINQVRPLLHKNKTDKMMKQPQKQLVLTDQQSNRVTVGLVSLITILALKITDLTFVASMSGALLGTSLIFIFPPLMFRSALAMESKRTNTPFTKLQIFERRLCSFIVGLGIFIAGVGTKMAWTR